MKKWIFVLSILLNIVLITIYGIHELNRPTYRLGRLEKDIEIYGLSKDSSIIKISKGLFVRDISLRGFGAIDQLENNRFEIIITSNDPSLVNYNISRDSLPSYGNLYSEYK